MVKSINLRMFGIVRLSTYVSLSDRSIIFNVTLLNRKFTTTEILLRNKRIKYQIITVVKIMTRLMSIRKASNTIDTRFNAGNERRNRSTRMMKSTKVVIKMEKSSELNSRIRRDIRSNTIREYTCLQHIVVNYATGRRY